MAWYRTGTVSLTNGSAVVTGLNTLWTQNCKVGDIFTLDYNRLYEIQSVDTDLQLTLTEAYGGATAAGLVYAIIPNFTYTTNADLASRIAALVNDRQTSITQMIGWLSGTATGGPNNDGTYPISDFYGNVSYVKSAARYQLDVDAAVTGAQNASDIATSAKVAADSATAEANQAVTDANSAKALSDAATAAATQATSDANAARDAANTAAGSANTAAAAANASKAAADTATSNADTATTQANSARDAANAAAAAANTAKTDTDTATANANTATAATNQAISDANTARDSANTAATSANDAAAAATTAKQNADAATTSANTAAASANQATSDANTARDAANTATSQANTARDSANTAASAANTAKQNADTATGNANTATAAANQATTDANTARDSANAAASSANTAKTNADTATAAANQATSAANTATTNANNAAALANAAAMNAQNQNFTTLSASTSVTSAAFYFAANAQYLYGKKADGTSTRLFGLNASNDLYIGGIDAAINSLQFGNTPAVFGSSLSVAGGALVIDVNGSLTATASSASFYKLTAGTGGVVSTTGSFSGAVTVANATASGHAIPMGQADGRYLGISAQAVDSAKLGGTAAASYATQAWANGQFLPLAGGTLTGAVHHSGLYGAGLNGGNPLGNRVTSYEDPNGSYGMVLWNDNGTSGNWATMLYADNNPGRKISFGKINTNPPTQYSHITEKAYVLLDDGSFHATGYLNGNDLRLGSATGASNQTLVAKYRADLGLGLIDTWAGATPIRIGGSHVKFYTEGGNPVPVYVHAHDTSTPTISLAIGDNDTGLNWNSDGTINFYANGVNVGYWNSSSMNITQPLYMNGSLVHTDGNTVYNTRDGWFRYQGDTSYVKLYGNSRSMVFRTDGNTQYNDCSTFPFVWLYNGDGNASRVMGLATSGEIWTPAYGWLTDKFVTKPVASGQNGVQRLLRSDVAADTYNVQSWWDGTYWQLKGYNDSTYHAGVRVATADAVQGLGPCSTNNSQANGLVRTDGSGFIQTSWIGLVSSDMGSTPIGNSGRVYVSNDSYIRYKTMQNFANDLGTYMTAANSTKWNGASKTVSTAAPSGGADGDVWFQYS